MEANQCSKLLENGIYTTLNITKSGDFHYDLKKYYESDQFKKDFKAQKLTFGAEAIDPETLVKTVLNFGASDDEVNEFQLKIKSLDTIKISQSFFDSFTLHTPNKDLIVGYVKCLEIQNNAKGLSTIVQEAEEGITIFIMYNKISNTDPSPIVENYTITNGTEISKSFKKGKKLDKDNSITIKRKTPDNEVFFFLDTNKGPVNVLVKGIPSGFNKDFPVGTIINSYLAWDEFQNVTKNNFNNPDTGIWNSKYSKWSPCDGRAIDNSSGLARASTNLTNVPDLRGTFLRGYNKFDPSENLNGIAAVSPAQKDPNDNRVRGEFQQDQIISHTHNCYQPNAAGLVAECGDCAGVIYTMSYTSTSEQYNGGVETRPKNVAINYYIRIN
jgi:hypothetical protein